MRKRKKPVSLSVKKKVCHHCCHTYQRNQSIICVQNSQFNSSCEVNLNNSLCNTVIKFLQKLLDIPEAGFPNGSIQGIDVRPPTIDDLRKISVANFTNKKEVSRKHNHMTIKMSRDTKSAS